MRYRTRTGKELGDNFFISDLSKGVSSAAMHRAPLLTRLLSGGLGYFVGTCAFLTRSFLRVKLGERTFGLFTFLFAYLIVYLIFLYPQGYQITFESFFDESQRQNIGVIILTFIGTLFYLPFAIWQIRKGEVVEGAGEVAFSLNMDMPLELDYFILITIVLGVGQLVDVYIRRATKDVVHSFYRGDSIFWGWLRGRKIGPIIFTDTRIWMLVEPLFILLVANLLSTYLGLNYLSLVLIVSAFCLFLEEYKVYMENRKFILDMLDGRLDAAYMNTIQEEYSSSILSENKNSTKNFRVSLGGTTNVIEDKKGSTSKYRVKLL
jgi:hypothetical protein